MYSLAYSSELQLVPPYSWERYIDHHDSDWKIIYDSRPVQKQETPNLLKLPGNLAPGDQPLTLGTKYMSNEISLFTEDAKKIAIQAAREADPALAKKVDNVQNKADGLAKTFTPKMETTTMNIHHDLKYDLPTNVAYYTATMDSLNFQFKHETFSMTDHASIAYKLNSTERIGLKTDTPWTMLTLFLEGSW